MRFVTGVSQHEKDLVVAAHGVRKSKKLRGDSSVDKWELPAGKDPKTAALEILLNPQVEFAEPNFLISKDDVTPNDPQFNQQWALRNTGQNGGQLGSDINASSAWETTKGSESTVVAVIDSGIDFTHPDLANNQWTNPQPSADGDEHGWDYVADSGEIKDEQGHGTAVAGIIAAEGNNSIGVSGVMWRAGLMSLRVLNNTGTGDVGAAVEAIDYAATHGAHVINLSWGTTGESAALKDAIERAIRRNVVVVCSAGNGGKDLNTSAYYPASYALKGLITVAGSGNTDQLATWSNYGSVVTVAAPGTDILTTQMGGGYWNVTGTSAAAPIVTGIAALLKTVRGTMNAQAVSKAITDGARQSVPLQGKVSSAGIANAAAALAKVHGPAEQAPDFRRGPQFGSGGTGPGGSFSTTPPAPLTAPGMSLPNLEEARKNETEAPKTKAPIESNLPCADCDPYGGGGGGTFYPSGDPNFSTARRRLINETGQRNVDLGSRNFNWSVPLLNLKGRAGLDLSLTLSYNSLVWTKDGSYMKFNADLGTPAPGFRLGLPTLQQKFLNSATGIYAYLMVLPSGSRVELRQVSTNAYESQDGSNMYLDDSTPSAPFVLMSDGTRFSFTQVSVNSEFRCTQIKDRNGNYISATYNTTNGHPLTMTDTLGRVITFVYDANSNLTSIRQTWAGATHDWATFYYGQVYVAPAFGGGLQVNGPNNNYTTVLTQVNLHDGSYFVFDYNAAFAQVTQIKHYAPDTSLLNYIYYNLNTAAGQTECPRVTARRDWARNWNGDSDGVPVLGEEATTTYSAAADNSYTQQTTPDGVTYKEFFFTSGWQNGLTSSSEIWSGGVRKKWSTTAWTQDNTGLTYQKNPRVTETNVYDEAGNRKRVDITYTSYNLPYEIREYAADATNFIRRTYIDYNFNPAYIARRIIGLQSAVHVVDHNNQYVSKITYDYDWNNDTNTYLIYQGTAVQHDATNYSQSFIGGRGNLTAVRRWNVNAINDANQALYVAYTGYNTHGSLIFSADNLGHETRYSYTDSFSDSVNRNSFAYPTTITDPGSFAKTVQYNYDFGQVTRAQDPKGAVDTITYDSAGRTDRVTNQTSGAYARYVYGIGYVQSYATVQSGAGEAYSITYFDGAGRVRAEGGDLPNSTGAYTGKFIFYDVMGRVSQRTNPAEMNGSWVPTGDDAAGWVSTTQTYDWNSRPLLTTNPDGTTRESVYGGCGCAGSDVVTKRDEQGRRKRYTNDVLGRLAKVEELNWNQTVYSTTTYSFNARDQLTTINQAGQTRTFAYDGHGRLQSRTTPEQGTTSYTYFGDDDTQTVTDARGATTTFAYNSRGLNTGITYGVPGGVASTPNVTFGYDSAGNRTSMTDGLGSVSYVYNTLSQLTSETRTFTGLGSYTLSYGYNLAGQLSSITNPWSAVVGYGYDKIGRTTSVSGSGYAGVSSYISSMTHRAFGTKQINYGNGRSLSLSYDNRLRLTQWSIPSVLRTQYNYQWELDGRVGFVRNLDDETLDRYYGYDHVGRLTVSRTGNEARLAINEQVPLIQNGPYSHGYSYDQFGNITGREGWGGTNPTYGAAFTNNKMTSNTYDASGNLTNAGGGWTFTYDATGQQSYSAVGNLQSWYDGERLRGKKSENGTITYYLRSTVLGGQVIAEIAGNGDWARGYVYLGGDVLAVQYGGVYWMHQEPMTKSKRITNSSGTVVSSIELDPWGGETNRSSNEAFQPRKFTSYERDSIASDDAMHRRYNRWWARFEQPDPYDGSYDLSDPQSFNRYAYTQNDPVNFTDPDGLMCGIEYSFSACGGGAGFWGGGGGFGSHVADFNREFGGLPPNIVSGMQNHNERTYNAIGGYGYITNAEVRQIQATVWVVDPETGERVFAGSAVWAEEGAWHERGIFGQIGLAARGFADELTMGFVTWVERKQGRLDAAAEDWLKTSSVHNGGAWVGLAAGLLIPGPGGKGTAAKGIIKGFTKHGINQAISRNGVGVSSKAILEAVSNPKKVVQGTNGAVKYIGQNAVVILNQSGKVITTWAKNSGAWRIKP